MTTLRGKLEFISLWYPIKLQTSEETIDLRDIIFPILDKWNGMKVVMDYSKKYFFLYLFEKSEHTLKFENDKEKETISIILEKPDGFTNLGAYLPNILQILNGRFIDIDIDNDFFKIKGVEEQTLYGLYYTKNNSCKIPDKDVNNICQPGTTHTCIFMTLAGDGFYCDKFDSFTARQLLYRYNEGTMKATRIGDCELLGRKEEDAG